MAKMRICDLCDEPIDESRLEYMRGLVVILFGWRRIRMREENEPSRRLDLHAKCFHRIMDAAEQEAKVVDLGHFLAYVTQTLVAEADTIMGRQYPNRNYNQPGPDRHKAIMTGIMARIASMAEANYG